MSISFTLSSISVALAVGAALAIICILDEHPTKEE
jgi:hypothetical protein